MSEISDFLNSANSRDTPGSFGGAGDWLQAER